MPAGPAGPSHPVSPHPALLLLRVLVPAHSRWASWFTIFPSQRSASFHLLCPLESRAVLGVSWVDGGMGWGLSESRDCCGKGRVRAKGPLGAQPVGGSNRHGIATVPTGVRAPVP